ncbi:MAG: hypothetical protein KatS3mg024_0150 [Armatimonadota bacterium]|nr:MAG: hypothetical protein KatS3mg024_0150 [Armatimonadota bacterium]
MTPQAALLALVWGAVLTLFCRIALGRFGRRVTNFRGDCVPSGYGVYVAAWGCALPLGVLASGDHSIKPGITLAFLVTAGSLGLLGFLDDAFGEHGSGGFGGHLRTLVRHGRVTTGLLKAAGGGLASLGAAWLLGGGTAAPHLVVLDGLLIALSANFINLLDLRPGRAGWTFLFLWAALCGVGLAAALPGPPVVRDYALLTLPAAVCLLVLLPGDSRGRRIMGDGGANPLGGVLGLGVCLLWPLWARVVWLGLLVTIHVFAERSSLSALIESVPLLRALDRRLGVR